MAGPWFAVREGEKSGWEPLGRVWISDGGSLDGGATLEMRERLLP